MNIIRIQGLYKLITWSQGYYLDNGSSIVDLDSEIGLYLSLMSDIEFNNRMNKYF